MSLDTLLELVAEPAPKAATVMQDDNVGRPVRIRWIDSGLSSSEAWGQHDTFAAKAAKVLDPVVTVGIWMGQNDDVVMVGQSHDASNDNWFAAELIYKPCIVSQEWLG